MVRTIRRSYFGVFAGMAAMALLCVLAGTSGAAAGDTIRITSGISGAEANGSSSLTNTSPNGRFLLIWSEASNLIAGDTNGTIDAFVYDRQTGAIQRVSVDSSGAQANSDPSNAYISPDGTYVVFNSVASNLVAGDTNGHVDIFAHERRLEPDNSPDDCIPPTTTATATTSSDASYQSGTWTNEDVDVSLTAQDNEGGSGIGTKFVEVDSGQVDPETGQPIIITVERDDIRYSATGAQSIPETVYDPENPPVINTEGTTTLSYFATDNMGNQESPMTFTVKIDKTPPQVDEVSPIDGAQGVERGIKQVSANFSESVQAATLTSSTVQLFSGNPLASDYSWSFTTGSM